MKRTGKDSSIRKLISSDEVYATTMLAIAIDTWGTECFEWHPHTLRLELEAEYGPVTEGNFDRLFAGIAILTTDLFFTDVARFIQLANVLAGSSFDPTVFDPADSAECAWAVTEALLLAYDADENPEPFSDDIRHYITAVLLEEGYVTPPDILKIAIDADFSSKVSFEFGDDPELFQSIYAVQQGKTQEITEILREGLLELLSELKLLPLDHGSTNELEARISQTIKAMVS